MFEGCSSLAALPGINMEKSTNMEGMYKGCISLTDVTLNAVAPNIKSLFDGCSNLANVTFSNGSANITSVSSLFAGCTKLQSVVGIDFSGLTSNLSNLFGYNSTNNLTRFIVSGKINVTSSDNYSIKALKSIDYESVKSILEAANRTDNTNSKTLAFTRTMEDPNGELAALVASCATKGWTITGLTLN